VSYSVDLFAEQAAVGPEEVIAFWNREAALDPAEAQRRVSEVLVVATDREGNLVGVSTSYLKRQEQLRAELWHTRVFVGAAHREAGIAIELALTARDHLVERHASGEETRGIGIVFEVESEILKRSTPQAVWPHTKFVFIGENARGDHVRVFYFPGALAPEPDADQGSA
jgi:hypothetical protein